MLKSKFILSAVALSTFASFAMADDAVVEENGDVANLKVAGHTIPQEIWCRRACFRQTLCLQQFPLPCDRRYYTYRKTGSGKTLLGSFQRWQDPVCKISYRL